MALRSLVGDLPAGEGLGEGGFVGGFAAGFGCHVGEGCLDVWRFGPDGNVFHFEVIGDVGLGEAAGSLGGWGEAVDAGDGAVSVAEAWGVASAGGGGGEAAGVDGGFEANVEEEGFDEGVQLLRLDGVGGGVGKSGVDEEALRAVDEVGVEGLGEVFGSGLGFRVAAGEDKDGEGHCCKNFCWGVSLSGCHRFSCRCFDYVGCSGMGKRKDNFRLAKARLSDEPKKQEPGDDDATHQWTGFECTCCEYGLRKVSGSGGREDRKTYDRGRHCGTSSGCASRAD